jgi:diguanylate cyclase (GGDEF)-like protein
MASQWGALPALRALYILPIWIGTRLGGRLPGFILVAFATAANVWLDSIDEFESAHTLPSGIIWLGVFSLVMLLVAHVEDALRHTEKLAHQDPLTGLYNRRGLEAEGKRVVQNSAKESVAATVAMLDCDRFKQINDAHGHSVGDEALRMLAAILRANTRESDVVSRLGGDEFVLVLADTNLDEAELVVDRIQSAFESGMRQRGISASLSVGLAQMQDGLEDLRTLVARADTFMYESKARKISAALAS